MDAAQLAAVVKMVPFSGHLGFEIKEMGPERVVVHALIKPEYCTTGGTAHGGFLMALADFAGACGAFQVLPEGAQSTTTIESKTNMMGAIPVGSTLVATATPLHVGRRTSVWVTRVESETGKLASVTTQTQMAL
ncbi:PaaI family thioesterase [Sandarakinorhabdus oryzae]|uniref:PaaI family thioesterase n=1 Tax=Sandarakinorhabdus oryzae TaxID=2675220 RepID=UPI0012E30AC0|nr:PaaI family thioesterase [Sandarakinorhabdus oryzae]